MLTNNTSKAIFLGNDLATEFPFTFKVWDIAQLLVHVIDPEEVETPALGWTAELSENGGTITYLHAGEPLPAGYKLSVLRNMPFIQEIDLITGTRFDPHVIEQALDQATAERQQLQEAINRSVKIGVTSNFTADELLQQIFTAQAESTASANSAAQSASSAIEAANAASLDASQVLISGDLTIANLQLEAERQMERINMEGQASISAATAQADRAKIEADRTAHIVDTASEEVFEAAQAQIVAATAQADRAKIEADRAAGFEGVFRGVVLNFSGTFGGSDGKRPIPTGSTSAMEEWALCDGTNDTPDLRGKFIFGGDGLNQGFVGGDTVTEGHTLTIEELARHRHSYNRSAVKINGGSTLHYITTQAGGNTGYEGDSLPHSHNQNLPPYYTLAYIMKIA